MIGPTLGRYFGRRVLMSILTIFLIAFLIVFLFDFLDLVRSTVDRPRFDFGTALRISLYRIPTFSELVLPFATLFGAMTALLALSRRLELVVARASGISAWQFLLPALLVALGLGIFSSIVYNPFAAELKSRSDTLQLEMLDGPGSGSAEPAREIWLRQDSEDGESVIHADRAVDRGLHLGGVTVQRFDKAGRFRERIDATSADFETGAWMLRNAVAQASGRDTVHSETLRLPTKLKREQVGESLAQPDTISFWALPAFIETARNAGLPAYQFELQYQLLLARPVLLAAMVLIAATVSLRVFRFGNIGRLILGGVAAGFVLYVVGEVARGLGGAGMVPPFLAAWSPAVVASSLGFTFLLYLEDG